jgi:hypothetical protein
VERRAVCGNSRAWSMAPRVVSVGSRG